MSQHGIKTIRYEVFEMVYCETGSKRLVAFNKPLHDLLASTFVQPEHKPNGEWIFPGERDKLLCLTLIFLHNSKARKDMLKEINRVGDTRSNGILYAVARRGKFGVMLDGVIKMVEEELDRHREYYRNSDIL